MMMIVKDRFAGLSGSTGFRGGFRGAPRGGGGFRGGFRGGGLGGRGGFRGGFGGGGGGGGGGGAGRDFSNQDLYADYNGPDSSGGPNGPSGGGLRMDQYGGGGGYGGGGYGGYEPEPSQQIMVRNVCDIVFSFEVGRVTFKHSCLGRLPMRIW